MASGAKLVSLVVDGRRRVNQLYSLLLQLGAKTGHLPCSALDAYRVVRDRQEQIENAIVEEVKAKGVLPPQTVPRSLASFVGCTPGAGTSIEFPEQAVKGGLAYLQDVKARRKIAQDTLTGRYNTDAGFKRLVDVLLAKLVNSPKTIDLIVPFFTLGGDLWEIIEAAKVMNLDVVSMTEAGVLASNNEVDRAASATRSLIPPDEKRSRFWPIAGAVAGSLVLAGGVWYVMKKRGNKSFLSDYYSDDPETDIFGPEKQLPEHVIDAEYEEVA